MTGEMIIFYEQVGLAGMILFGLVWLLWNYRSSIFEFFKGLVTSKIEKTAEEITNKVVVIQDQKLDKVIEQMAESTSQIKEIVEKHYKITNDRMDIIEESTKMHYKLLDKQIKIIEDSVEKMSETNKIMSLHISELEIIHATQKEHEVAIQDIKKRIA